MQHGTWQKRGLIFTPRDYQPWFLSHATAPVADPLRDDCYRIYFSGRDGEGRSQIGYFDLDLTAPDHLLAVSSEPIVRLGQLGHLTITA